MPILGLNYRKINAEKKGALTGVSISTTPKITDVKKTKLSGLGEDIDILAIDFEFKSTYEPNGGEISIEGTIIYRTEDAEKALKMWKKDKKMPENINIELTNYLFAKVGIFALQVSDTMQMPPVVGMPRIAPKAEKKE